MSASDRTVLVVGSGIAGLSAAIHAAECGMRVVLVSPYPSERAQSVMAAGGINAALDTIGEGDSYVLHAQETMDAGCYLENLVEIERFCKEARDVILWLEGLGVLFDRLDDGRLAQRAFGGQSKCRTVYSGTATGKQIVTSLVQKCREFEIAGLVERRLGLTFHSALIDRGICYGALFADILDNSISCIKSDATIFAVGGMNGLFGTTTGSRLCDGFAVARLLSQGVELRNLEFVQFHPTTVETAHKRMLISEAARGEGGRLYFLDEGKRIYFMEDRYGARGNLMPRDIVSKCIAECPSQVYLDISFLGEKLIHNRLQEIYDLCLEYCGIDVCAESIPVAPAAHFFMGGIRVDANHHTNINGLYAIGECASKYHGANRLGGNSLLAAVYSGKVAAQSIDLLQSGKRPEGSLDFKAQIGRAQDEVSGMGKGVLASPPEILRDLSPLMNTAVGLLRDRDRLEHALEKLADLEHRLARSFAGSGCSKIDFRNSALLLLARACARSALSREESRGSHQRLDFPETNDAFQYPSIASCENGALSIRYDKGVCPAKNSSVMGGRAQ